jgi:hypothetical protein
MACALQGRILALSMVVGIPFLIAMMLVVFRREGN